MKRIPFALAVVAVLFAGAARADSEAHVLFEKKCAVCHGKDGKPTKTGQTMGAKELTTFFDAKGDVAPLVASIANGKGTKMQAFKGKLTEAQISGLAKYIRNGLKD